MKRYYRIGEHLFSIEKTSSGYYVLAIEDAENAITCIYSTLQAALLEMVSYARVFVIEDV